MASITAGRNGHGTASRRVNGARSSARRAARGATRDFETLFADAEALLHSTVDVVGDQAKQARERLQESLEEAKERFADDIESLTDRGREAASAVDEFVHVRPWHVIGVAAVAAIVTGFVLGRR